MISRVYLSFVLAGVFLLAGLAGATVGGSAFELHFSQLGDVLLSYVSPHLGPQSPNGDLGAQLIATVRLPRVLIAAGAGAALAMAGTLMQGLTRNPLASPALFGINAGAACMMVLAQTGVLPVLSDFPLIISTALGAALAGILVLALGGGLSGRLHPTRMVLAGVALSALLLALTRALLILDEQSQGVLSWLAGSLTDTGWDHWQQLWPWLLSGGLLALLLSQKLNLLALGDDISTGLGAPALQIRLWASLAVIMLTASCVAITGPIAFVGLLIPHLGRNIVGHDYRILLPFCGLLGAGLLSWADLISRYMAFPSETPVGLVTALLGAPCFIWLASRRREHGR
ncbi:FecCD family ABC transporter permease [Aliamphritea hakodatensis]|uniref:FecCD family ABC transporter permease n=1 Tax=Aliamphritea hakodatensis TaxID=2895352 RepID=UPI0022FD8940|nr:iron chelate uptake ABC transporter family permease subunit [Aliamphritea hakodatensis]